MNNKSFGQAIPTAGLRVVLVSFEKEDLRPLHEMGFQAIHWSPSVRGPQVAGRDLIVLAPDDPEGQSDAKGAVEKLVELKAASVEFLPVSGLGVGKTRTVASLLQQGFNLKMEIDHIIANMQKDKAELEELPLSETPEPKDGEPRAPGQVQVLLEIAKGYRLFHDSDSRSYAEAEVGGHFEVHELKSQNFQRMLRFGFYRMKGTAPTSESLTTAIRTLEARAVCEGERQDVSIRVGSRGESHYLDLCTDDWRFVEIDQSGWRVIDLSPIPFRRAPGMLQLADPESGATTELLKAFVNLPAEDEFLLLVAWVLFCHQSTGPFPILILQGEQGSSKSTMCKLLRRLIDPHATPLRSEPKSARDLMIAARASWLICLDNLSGVPAWLSDCLCRLATGGGYAVRANYTDDEEVFFYAMRPILLNGIDEIADRPDLLDRALVLNLPIIPEERRRTEAEFWGDFEATISKLQGALLDLRVEAIKQLPEVALERSPRMADFARFGEAVSRALELEEGVFMEAYFLNIKRVNESAAESSIVARAVLNLIQQDSSWEGLPSELLSELTGLMGEEAKSRSWPSTARKLVSDLMRLAPVLRRMGINYERSGGRTNRGRNIILTKISSDEDPADDVPVGPTQPSHGSGFGRSINSSREPDKFDEPLEDFFSESDTLPLTPYTGPMKARNYCAGDTSVSRDGRVR